MKMVVCNANHHKAAKSAITASGTDNDTYDDMDDDESANHGFLVKDDVPCHLAYDAGLDAVDGQ
jgi:hypothetical protein